MSSENITYKCRICGERLKPIYKDNRSGKEQIIPVWVCNRMHHMVEVRSEITNYLSSRMLFNVATRERVREVLRE